jgi:uracil-DNA glycosylase
LIEGGIAPLMLATVHPSSLLRMSDEAERKEAFDRLVADLALIVKAL